MCVCGVSFIHLYVLGRLFLLINCLLFVGVVTFGVRGMQ